jgi:sporulation integral membrane protein YtvI
MCDLRVGFSVDAGRMGNLDRLSAERARRQYLWRLVEVGSLLLLVAIFCVVFIWSLKYTLPFVIGGFISILLLPLAKQLEYKGVPRLWAVLTVMIGIGLGFLALSTFVIVAVTKEATLWLDTIPKYFTLVQDWVTHQAVVGKSLFGQLPPEVANNIQKTALSSLNAVQNSFVEFAKQIVTSVKNLPEYMFIVVIAVIATFFLLVNRSRMYRRFMHALPPGWSHKVTVVANDMMRAFAGSIRVQVVLMLMSAVLGVIGMWIFRIHYAVILGILFGVTGIIPILGSALLTIPWAAGALLIGDVSLALKVILLQLAISLIRHVVEPKILADSVGLDTLSTLFALYVGMKLIGVLGLFLGPIIMIGIKSLLNIRLLVEFFPAIENGHSQVDRDETSGEV